MQCQFSKKESFLLKLDEVQTRLQQHDNLSVVARGAGISPQQAWKVCHHNDINPLYRTVELLSDYFESIEGGETIKKEGYNE